MSVSTLVSALEGLQADAERRHEYNAWLQEFQRSPEAWDTVNVVLEGPEYARGLKIFCAQTLRNKIAYDLHQVPRATRMELKDRVLQLLEKNAELLSVVGGQLCIALAAFAMQVAEWEHPMEELMARFESRDMIPLLFEFLKVLPEEFNAARAALVDPELRLARSTTLIQNNAALVLNFMMARAEIMVEHSHTQTLFFEALKPWLSEVNFTELIESPLLGWMFDSFAVEDARAAAVDCLLVVLEETTDIHEIVVQQAIRTLYPRLMALPEIYAPQYEEDADLHADMTRLLGEAAVSWHALIARQPDDFLPLVRALAQTIMVSHMDLEVVEYTFPFFEKFRTLIGEPLPAAASSSATTSTPATLPRKQLPREPFVEIFLELFAAFTRLLEFPDSFNGNLEEEEVFRDFRYDIGDLLKICSSVAGHERALEWCHATLLALKASPRPRPQTIEAVLFSVRAIARTVPAAEERWMPRLLELFGNLPLAHDELVHHAALLVVGRYSQWGAEHPDYVKDMLRYITDSVWSAHDDVRRAAAHAFLYVVTDAAKVLVPSIDELIGFLGQLSGRIDLESMCKYSDGVGAVVNQVPEPKMEPYLDAVFDPVVARARELLAATAAGVAPSPLAERQVAIDIQSLGSVVAMINTASGELAEHPLISEMKKHHAVFVEMLARLGLQDAFMLESLARLFIHTVFNGGTTYASELESLLKAVVAVVEAKPVCPVLYGLSSAVVQSFNDRQDFPDNVDAKATIALVWQYSQVMARLVFSPELVRRLASPDLTDADRALLGDYMYHAVHFLCDLVVYFPEEFFFGPMFEATVVLSLSVLRMSWESEAMKALSHIYDDIASYVMDEPAPAVRAPTAAAPDGPPPAPKIPDRIRDVLERQGGVLMLALFEWFLLRDDPAFEKTVENMVDFVFRMVPVGSIGWLQGVLQTLPPGSVSDEEKMQFAQRVFQMMSSQRFRGIGHEMKLFVFAYAERNLVPR